MEIKEICSIESLRQFIKEGGDINENISIYNKDKNNILFFLLRKDGKQLSLALFEEIIKSGADINFLNDNNENLLFYATTKDLALLLIKYKIDMTVKNKEGLNPLFINLLPIEVIEIYLKNGMNISELSDDKSTNYFKSLLIPCCSKDTLDRMFLGLNYIKTPLPDDIMAVYLTMCKNDQKWYSEESLKRCISEIVNKGIDIASYAEEFKYVLATAQKYYEDYVKPYRNKSSGDMPAMCPLIEKMNRIMFDEYYKLFKRTDKEALYFVENIVIPYGSPEAISLMEKNILCNIHIADKKSIIVRI